jgi:hypothetical protein
MFRTEGNHGESHKEIEPEGRAPPARSARLDDRTGGLVVVHRSDFFERDGAE